MIANDEVLVGLRRQIDSENKQIRELRQELLALTSFRQGNLQVKKTVISTADGTRILEDYHKLITEHVKSQSTFGDSQLFVNKMTDLKREVELESQSRDRGRNEEIERVRGKSRYYRREIDQLEEFIRKEMEFERAEDEATIASLQRTIANISSEIASSELSLARKKEQENALSLASLTRRSARLKSEITALDSSLAELAGTRAQILMAIQLQIESNGRLDRELTALQAITNQA
jgi:hypothetical protein